MPSRGIGGEVCGIATGVDAVDEPGRTVASSSEDGDVRTGGGLSSGDEGVDGRGGGPWGWGRGSGSGGEEGGEGAEEGAVKDGGGGQGAGQAQGERNGEEKEEKEEAVGRKTGLRAGTVRGGGGVRHGGG